MNANLINALTHAKLCRQALGQANVTHYCEHVLHDCDALVKGIEDDIDYDARRLNVKPNGVKLNVVV